MKCPYCNNKVTFKQLLFTKGEIKCSNCNKTFYISKIKLYLPLIASLFFIYGTIMLSDYFSYNKNINILLLVLLVFLGIAYLYNIKPKK